MAKKIAVRSKTLSPKEEALVNESLVFIQDVCAKMEEKAALDAVQKTGIPLEVARKIARRELRKIWKGL